MLLHASKLWYLLCLLVYLSCVSLYIIPGLLWEIVLYFHLPNRLFAHLNKWPPNPRSWSGDKSIEGEAMPAETRRSSNQCEIQDSSDSSNHPSKRAMGWTNATRAHPNLRARLDQMNWQWQWICMSKPWYLVLLFISILYLGFLERKCCVRFFRQVW